jgi:putative DNA primase/helicase
VLAIDVLHRHHDRRGRASGGVIMDARAIANALGGDVIGRDGVSAPGPGHSKADRSLSIKLNSRAPGGFVVFSHAGDDPIACRDYVRDRLGLGQWERGQGRRTPMLKAANDSGPDPDQEKRKAWALQIWLQSTNPTGTLVERYLREHRGLELSGDVAGSVIRFHGRLKFDETYLPGMVCLLRDIKSDEPCGIHRTFLDRKTGEKIDRRMLGIAKNAAIKLDQAGASLTIGEGVETALSGRMAGLGPVWALGSSVAVRSFPVLKSLKEITILEENDPTSQRDVAECARRYFKAGKPVNIVTPDIGNDLNDAWRATR